MISGCNPQPLGSMPVGHRDPVPATSLRGQGYGCQGLSHGQTASSLLEGPSLSSERLGSMPICGGSLQQPEEEGPFSAWHMAGRREATLGPPGTCIQNEEAAWVTWQGGAPNLGALESTMDGEPPRVPLPGWARQPQCSRCGDL